MIELHTARAEERAEVCRLWELVFGDDEAFLEKFFQLCAPYEDTFALLEDGGLRSILCAPEMTLCCPNGKTLRSGYMYALATDPAARGKGFGQTTMVYGASCLKNWGADCAILVPAEPSLFRFFEAIQYSTRFFLNLWAFGREDAPAVGAGRMTPAAPEEYNALRRRWLDGRLYADCSDELVTFQKHLAQSCGGDIWRLELPGGEGCAVVEPAEGAVQVKELLCAEQDIDQAAALLCARYPAERYEFRLPPWTQGRGQRLAWGAVRWLYDRPSPWCPEDADGYLGLAFD
jgi:GNAT superfamily N-acetyltransferase